MNPIRRCKRLISSALFGLVVSFCVANVAFAAEQSQAPAKQQKVKMVPVYVPTLFPQDAPAPAPANIDMSTVSKSFKDIPYAKVSPANKLDIYLPANGKAPYPVVVNIHGGAFFRGDKADFKLNAQAPALTRGYALVSINYRLSYETEFPGSIYDVKAAIRWIKANAKKYGFNPKRIAVWGDSSGAHLAAMIGTTSHGVPLLEDKRMGNANQDSSVHAVVDWFGPIDFLAMDEQFTKSGLGKASHGELNSPESQYIRAKITDAPFMVKVASPASYIAPGKNPYFLIQHGTKDMVVPFEQSADFAAKLKKVIGEDKVTFIPMEGANHVPPDVKTFHSPENIKVVLDWLDKHMK
jgi:acetyl esterase/lipase